MKQVLVGDLGISQLLEEAFVFIASDLTLVSLPNGLQVIEHLPIQLDGITDELRELLDNLLNLSLRRELSAIWSQLQSDLGTSLEA